MATIGWIDIGMSVATNDLKKGLGAGRSMLGGFESAVGGIGGKLAALGAALGLTFSADAFFDFTLAALKSADALNDAADRIGTTSGKLAELRYIAQLTGSEAASLDGVLEKMNSLLGDAADKGGPAAKALASIGLDAKQLAALDPADAFKAIAGGFQKLENPAERASKAIDVFGRGGMALMTTLNAGPEQFAKLAKEAAKFHLALDGVDADNVAAANDAIDRLGFAFQGLGNVIAVQVAPFVAEAINAVVEFGAEGDRVAKLVQAGFDFLFIAFEKTLMCVYAFNAFWGHLTEGAENFLQVLERIASPLLLISAVPAAFKTVKEGIAGDFNVKPDDKLFAWFAEIKKRANESAAALRQMHGDGPGKALGSTFVDAKEKLAAFETKLQEEINSFGLSGEAAELYKLRMAGLGPELTRTAEDLVGMKAALDKAAKSQEELASKAKSVIEESRNPFEVYAEKLKELGKMRDKHLINADVFDRASKAAGGTFKESATPGFSAALKLGSAEARSADLARTQRRDASDPLNEIAKTGLKGNELLTKVVEYLGEMAKLPKTGTPELMSL